MFIYWRSNQHCYSTNSEKISLYASSMKRFLQGAVTTVSALCALVIAPVFLSSGQAIAAPLATQPTGTNASYLGAGISVGVTNGGNPGNDDDAQFGGNVQGRFAIPNTPLSARGAVLFTNKSAALMPMISYDVPVTNNANVYLGAGYSFVTNDGRATPLGNKDAVVLATGVEAQMSKNIVVYGDAKLGIDAYKDSSGEAVSLQTGVAYRFN